MKASRCWIIVFALAALAAPALSSAQSVTCTPSSTIIDFGAFDVLSNATLPGTGTVTITCARSAGGGGPIDVSYQARLTTSTTRQMQPLSGTDRVTYQIYTDAARTTVWGDGTSGTLTINGGPFKMNANSQVTDTFTYYGLISPGGQDVSAASPGPPPTTYSQTLTITVTCTPSPAC